MEYIRKNNLTANLGNKKEFFAVDVFRIIFAIAIVSIHVPPFADVSNSLNYFSEEILARLGVPFFFLVSGFFICNKLNDIKKIRGYLHRMLQLYLVYTLLYFPQIVFGWIADNTPFMGNLLIFIKDFLLVGSYGHLWYFVALIVAVLLLYLFVEKLNLSKKHIIMIALTLYAVGTIGNAYIYPLIKKLNTPISMVEGQYLWLWLYFKIFVTTRNGLFLGFPYFFFGYLIASNKNKIYRKHYFIFSLVFFILMIGEAFIAYNVFGAPGQEIMFMLFPTVLFAFLSILFIDCKNSPQNAKLGKHLRRISLLFFGLHNFIRFYLRGFFKYILGIEVHSLLLFLLVLIFTFIVSEIIIYISRFKYFKWVKIFY